MSINPIIPGYAPDPSAIRVDGWFFLVNSSFHCFPGLPIYASKDLVSWKQIGNALHRRSQLSLEKTSTTLNPMADGDVLLATGGLYAPTLRHHEGIFYLVCTNITRDATKAGKERSQNFIITCKDIWAGEWSDPVTFDFAGIDPSIFWDDDGKVYIQGSRGPGPKTKINQFEIELATGRRLSEEKTLWEGTGGKYPEGPHLYKNDGWYYVEISEGGTHEGHAVTIARSENVWGPYEPCPHNPILTARETNEYIQYTGHCDVFQDQEGRWWGVCLGVRKDPEGRLVLGRETFITPAEWKDGWLALERVQLNPTGLSPSEGSEPFSAALGVDWLYIRDVNLENYRRPSDSAATLTATPIDLSHPEVSPSFTGKRQRKLAGQSTANLTTPAAGSQIRAGLAVYKDEHRWVRILFDSGKSRVVYELRNGAKAISKDAYQDVSVPPATKLKLQIQYSEKQYRFLFDAGQGLSTLATTDTLDMTGTDFVGPVIGVFAVAEQHGTEVVFDDITIE